MLRKKILGIGFIFTLFISMFSGCIFLEKTTFVLLSATVANDSGFAGLNLRFNASNIVTVTWLKTSGDVLYNEQFYRGISTVCLPFGLYRTTPQPDSYQVKVVDKQNTIIFQQTYNYSGGNLTVSEVKPYWCNEYGWGTLLSLVGLNITVRNHGDLPIYPETVGITVDGKQTSGDMLPTVVLPGYTASLCCFVHIENISTETQYIDVSLKNSEGQLIGMSNSSVTPIENAPAFSYTWEYNGQRHILLPNPGCLLAYYKSLPRPILDDYAMYVFDTYDDEYLHIIAKILQNEFSEYTTNVDRINAVASFVQNMDYTEDDPNNASYEYPRYPIEMLCDQQGDCEDKAILLAALLETVGYNVSLLRIPDHMAVGVHLDKNSSSYLYYAEEYFYLETTRAHWVLGRVPPEYQGLSNTTIYPISSRPVLLHNWRNATRYTGRDGTDFIKLHIFVQNLGKGEAQNVEIRGAFFSQDNIMFNQEIVTSLVIPPAEKVQVSLKVTVPQGESTLLKTQVYMDNKRVDEKESTSWFTSKLFSESSSS